METKIETPAESLDDIRRELDAIDDEMHALIQRRTLIMHRVAAAKARENGGNVGFAVRPGREAQMIRRLLGQHKSELPFGVIYRIWKELINGQTRVQTALDLGIHSDAPDALALLDLARNQFASNTPLKRFENAAALVDAVAGEGSLAGVLDASVSGWWRALADNAKSGEGRAYIIVALPFLLAGAGGVKAVALGPLEPEPAGDDVTFAVFPPGVARPETGAQVLDETADGAFLMLDGFYDAVALAEQWSGALYMGASARQLVIES